jgi:hypothetical protein
MDAGNDARRDPTHGGPARTKRTPLIRHLALGLGMVATATLALVALQAPASAQGGGPSAQVAGDEFTQRCTRRQLIANGDFEYPRVGAGFSLFSGGGLVAWRTNDPNNRVELWRTGFLGTWSHSGRQHAEINATGNNNSLYQDIRTRPGTLLRWTMSYRARNSQPGADFDVTTLRFGRTPAQGSGAGFNAVQVAAAGNTEHVWRTRTGTYFVPFGQPWTRVTLTAASTSGPAMTGNLVDRVSVIGIRCN